MAGATATASSPSRWPRPSPRCCSASPSTTARSAPPASMLFDRAVKDGTHRCHDDRAKDYVSARKGGAYGETSLRALLTMSSGVPWTETYSPGDDNARFGRALFVSGSPGAAALLRA